MVNKKLQLELILKALTILEELDREAIDWKAYSHLLEEFVMRDKLRV